MRPKTTKGTTVAESTGSKTGGSHEYNHQLGSRKSTDATGRVRRRPDLESQSPNEERISPPSTENLARCPGTPTKGGPLEQTRWTQQGNEERHRPFGSLRHLRGVASRSLFHGHVGSVPTRSPDAISPFRESHAHAHDFAYAGAHPVRESFRDRPFFEPFSQSFAPRDAHRPPGRMVRRAERNRGTPNTTRCKATSKDGNPAHLSPDKHNDKPWITIHERRTSDSGTETRAQEKTGPQGEDCPAERNSEQPNREGRSSTTCSGPTLPMTRRPSIRPSS